MTRAFALEALGIALEQARDYAVKAGMDEHFISDIKHLAVVCDANKQETQTKGTDR